MKQNILKLLFLIIILSSMTVQAEESSSPIKLQPLFNLDSSRTFSPDFSTSNEKHKAEVNLEKDALKQEKSETKVMQKPADATNLKFQISNPKDVMYPVEVIESKTSIKPQIKVDDVKENSKEKIQNNSANTTLNQLKPRVDVAKTNEKKAKTITFAEKLPSDKSKEIVKSETKVTTIKNAETNKPHSIDKTKQEAIIIKDHEKFEKKVENKENQSKTPKKDDKKAIIKISSPVKDDSKANNIGMSKEEVIEVKTKQALPDKAKTENTQLQPNNNPMPSDSSKEKQMVSPNNLSDQDNETSVKNDIDFYLKKYNSTFQGNANVNEYKISLIQPFKESLFYKVLLENKAEGIELQTYDINANLNPEAIVSFNVPLGAEGEYACQVMVLEQKDVDLNKLWVSELIPGKIDSVQIQDVNNDGQNDIIVVSTTGGVSLLKSVRVYTYEKSKNSFNTIFAMNSIMEGIVSVKQNKILISETFPGGINKAALYMWNGQRFERLEL